MRLTAILAVRNESLYIGRCCQHLASQGIDFAIIDNESTDDTRAIAESFRGRGLICLVSQPYPGFYDWTALLNHKERLARELDGDWFLHLDADEIPEPPPPHESLLAKLAAVDAEGYSAVNFDEFVFVPTSEDERYEGGDYVRDMHQYYFFEPSPRRLVRAWKRRADIDLASSAGHAAAHDPTAIYPQNFVLRHYIALSMEHLRRKYLRERVYSPAEVARGWHAMRARLSDAAIRTPAADDLFDLRDHPGWNRTRPRHRHAFVR